MTTISKHKFFDLIQNQAFTQLFNQFGWSYRDQKNEIVLPDQQTFVSQLIAEMTGFVVLTVRVQKMPTRQERIMISQKIQKSYYEHLIIFHNPQQQIWHVPIRKPNQATQHREVSYFAQQQPELIWQKLQSLFFTIDELDHITLVDIKFRMAQGFGASEKVTKKFYEQFKKEHHTFAKFVEGIEDQLHIDWYISLMLNRLMFVYFIQKKKFLDSDTNYLPNKLQLIKSQYPEGTSQFYDFYRKFLKRLFHEGLGKPHEQNPELKALIGTIPYLNGGLFEEHWLEKNYTAIQIQDQAFERIFAFFDQYDWHLDTRQNAKGNEINPDVIGFIFEKYINERAKMGAYYTKEDITDYISKNTILPYLIEQTLAVCPTDIFAEIPQSEDRYLYDALKKGTELTLPPEIAEGIHDIDRRGEWNKAAAADYALPTEIWRETIERRQRYENLCEKIRKGEIRSVQDFVSLNLNLKQWVQDYLQTTENADWIAAFYAQLQNLTVLDPTCGSGAFLFAALNILEPLYAVCLDRMNDFERPDFEAMKAKLNMHPNPTYFIYKQAILHNLYGVDMMHEATEIAKLRLFLKLVSVVEPNYRKPNLGLEPLPDIDFNIRCGNTLVGFATLKQLENQLLSTLDYGNQLAKFKTQAQLTAKVYQVFKNAQLNAENSENPDTQASIARSKVDFKQQIQTLQNQLNGYLAEQYGKAKNLEDFLKTHQPFHWIAEFYEIIEQKGGFDVVIGNPPYVEYTKVKNEYTVKDFETEKCGNLYAMVMEKIISISKKDGYTSYIVPLAGLTTDRMLPLQKILLRENQFLINVFIESTTHPSTLFDGVQVQVMINIFKKGISEKVKIYSTNYLRFYAVERPFFFEKINLFEIPSGFVKNKVPKMCSILELSILEKIAKKTKKFNNYVGTAQDNILYYRRLGNFSFKLAFSKPPTYIVNGINQISSTVENIYIKNIPVNIAAGLIGSTLVYWYWVLFSNVMDFKIDSIYDFGFDYEGLDLKIRENLLEKCNQFAQSLEENSQVGKENRANGNVAETARYFPQKSKPIIDEIDKVLGAHYGFTAAELDFIINYDIKYRMGKELEE